MAQKDRAEATRLHLLTAAAEVFGEHGYSSANLNDIMLRAKVTKGGLYFHFDSKERLARELIDERHRRGTAAVLAITNARMPALEKAIQITLTIIELYRSDQVVRAGDRLLLEIGDYRGHMSDPMPAAVDTLAGLFTQAIADGDLRPELDPDAVARIVCSQMIGARVVERVVAGGPDIVSNIREMWRLVLATLVPESKFPYFTEYVARACGSIQLPAAVES